jgi:hypothetical protein
MVSRDEIRKLMGGYATGTLTESERKLLFDAAMEDQDLFDELAREQELKAVLDQPGAKQRLIGSLAAGQAIAWWRKPLVWSAASGVLVATVAISWVLRPTPVTQVSLNESPPAIEAAPAQASNQPAAPPIEARKAKPAPDLRDARTDSPGRQAGGQPEKDTAAPVKPAAPKEEARAEKKAENSIAKSSDAVQVAAAQAEIAPRPAAPPAAAAPLMARPAILPRRFAFDYSLEDQQLVLKFSEDGYFSIHFSPGLDTIVDSSVIAGSSRRLQIPNNATEATIVFSPQPQTTSGGVNVTRENKIGSVDDPARQRIELLLKFYP